VIKYLKPIFLFSSFYITGINTNLGDVMSERNIKFWANVSTRYDTAIDIILGENLRPKILGKLNKEENMGKLIEFGCGSGYFTRTLADKSENLISTDISEEMLKLQRKD